MTDDQTADEMDRQEQSEQCSEAQDEAAAMMTNEDLAAAIEKIEKSPTRMCMSCRRRVPINDWDYGICGRCRVQAGCDDDDAVTP